MPKKQNVILRMTVNIDMTQDAELSITRAFLTRMNVLHASTKPGARLGEILKGAQLREHFEAGRKAALDRKLKKETTPSQSAGGTVAAQPVVEKPKGPTIDIVDHTPPVRINWRPKHITELSFAPPLSFEVDVGENS